MGGCRCTFRECTNNTVNSPGKHFFHFPYKDSERCKKWALSSDKISFLQLPWTQLRNKTICEDHFVDTCFMNFKRERLVKTAIPTRDRTVAGGVIEIKLDESKLETLDYCFMDKGTNQQIIDLPDTQHQQQQQVHRRQRPQSLPDQQLQKRVIHVNLSVNENPGADDDDDDILDTYVVSDPDPLSTVVQAPVMPDKSTSVDCKPLVLNRICPKRVKRIDMRKASSSPEKVTILPKQIGFINDEIETTYIPNKRIKSEFGSKRAPIKPSGGRTYGNLMTVTTRNDTVETVSPSLEIEPTENCLNDTITANILEKINHMEERDANKVDKSLYLQMMEEHAKQIEDLKKLLTDKLTTDKKPELSEDAASGSDAAAHSSAGTRFVRVERGPAMTKVQLFNGIRKYLNPTMVALLRMEMFGSAEREYRPDERQLSKELYNLNQSVYDYMRDEWRFRLPPKAEVDKWLKDSDSDETWELC